MLTYADVWQLRDRDEQVQVCQITLRQTLDKLEARSTEALQV